MNSLGWKISNRGLATKNLVIRMQSRSLMQTNLSVNSNTDNNTIKIPLRKERGPTDILFALEKTISRDPTAPKYKYHDDPYLIPYSNSQKRTFALSQESGRKTAMWLRKEHSNLFNHRIADPIINEYLPKAIYNNKDDVNEDILNNVIANGHVNDALNIYKLLDENTSIETKQSLFELLCFYNNQEPISDEFIEEKWFKQSDNNNNNNNNNKTWKNCPDTEKLFTILTNNNNDKIIIDKAYNTMICGTAKYNKFERSFGLFEEALNNNISLSITTFNSIIKLIPLLKEGFKERKDLLIDILEKIKNTNNILPNILTLNNSLKVASSLNNHGAARELCRSLFTEFNNIGIEPSLASYNYALQIYYRNGGLPNSSLYEIIKKLEDDIVNNNNNKKELTIKDNTDTYFFVTAMSVASNNLDDSLLGDRIHKILLTNNNYNFIGDGLKENIYYRHYFMLQVRNNKIDDFVEKYYNLIVPHVYTPEPSVMDEILNATSAHDPDISRKLLPIFWTHIVQFDQLERKNLVAKALNLMRTHCKPLKNDDKTNEIFGEAAWTVWNFVNTQRQRRMQNMNWSGTILGDVAVLCLRANKYDRWSSVVSYLYNKQSSIIGTPDINQINEILDECILNCYTTPALDLINYCVDTGFEDTGSMAFKVFRNLPLANHEEKRLKSLVGSEVFEIQLKE